MLEAALTAGCLCSVGGRRGGPGRFAHPRGGLPRHQVQGGCGRSSSRRPTTRWSLTASKCSPPPAISCPTRWEARIEATSTTTAGTSPWPPGAGVGQVSYRADGLRDYVDHLYEAIGGDLSGLNICIDLRQRRGRRGGPEAVPPAGGQMHLLWGDAGRQKHQRRGGQHPPGKDRERSGWPAATTAASPLTGTPTGAWPATKRARRSTATRSSPCWP